MGIFRNRFFEILDEEYDEAMTPEEIDKEGDSEAFSNSFENPSDAEGFGASDEAINTLDEDDRFRENVKTWAAKIDDFTDWLQLPEGNSLSKELNRLDRPDTKYEGIAKQTTDKIKKVAQELASLKQVLYATALAKNENEVTGGVGEGEFAPTMPTYNEI